MGRAFGRLSLMIKELVAEIKSRRRGRRGLPARAEHNAVREVVGPTGFMWSRGWDTMAAGAKAFENSFDPHLPPSLHISEQERHRFHLAIPVAERCLEDQSRTTPERSAGLGNPEVEPGQPA